MNLILKKAKKIPIIALHSFICDLLEDWFYKHQSFLNFQHIELSPWAENVLQVALNDSCTMDVSFWCFILNFTNVIKLLFFLLCFINKLIIYVCRFTISTNMISKFSSILSSLRSVFAIALAAVDIWSWTWSHVFTHVLHYRVETSHYIRMSMSFIVFQP